MKFHDDSKSSGIMGSSSIKYQPIYDGDIETVTESIDDYVSVAVRLARDVAWRMAVKERILANKHKVYRGRTCIAALEQFLNLVARGESVAESG